MEDYSYSKTLLETENPKKKCKLAIDNYDKYPFLTEFGNKKIYNHDHIPFVIGVPCSGKSTFIKEKFSDREVIDIYDIQINLDKRINDFFDVTVRSSEIVKYELITHILAEKPFVLEHTLFKAKRRKVLIDEIIEISRQFIDVYVMYPSMKRYELNCECRDIVPSQEEWKAFEILTSSEGFDQIYYVDEDGVYTKEQFYQKLKKTELNYYNKEKIIEILLN